MSSDSMRAILGEISYEIPPSWPTNIEPRQIKALTQIKHLSTSLQNIQHGSVNELPLTQIHGQIVLQLLSDLLILIVGEQILAGMVGVVTQPAIDDMLADAVRQAARVVAGLRGEVAALDALDEADVVR